MANHVQLNLDLDTEIGVKALLALAGAFGPSKVLIPAPVSDERLQQLDTSKLVVADGPLSGEPEAPRPPASADIDSGSTSTSAASGQPAAPAAASATPAAGEKPKRRRTKAQKEEDEADGLEAAFQKALKDHPDLDVDTIRDMIRGNREAADSEAVAMAGVAAEVAAPPEISSAGEDEAPGWDAPAWDAPAEPDNTGEDWAPTWD